MWTEKVFSILLPCLDALESDENRRASAVVAEASGTLRGQGGQEQHHSSFANEVRQRANLACECCRTDLIDQGC